MIHYYIQTENVQKSILFFKSIRKKYLLSDIIEKEIIFFVKFQSVSVLKFV